MNRLFRWVGGVRFYWELWGFEVKYILEWFYLRIRKLGCEFLFLFVFNLGLILGVLLFSIRDLVI